ncbi:uncharacterized protein LTR77_006700 [Saxophila tyrrhenica]|uniref:FAD-dependent oxidoreductase n=1 Tax=Saxophila tyrrhenica TaxID=1690608 RepID=A0AAV9P7K5_9PEZI|nr:hypothetical protein LTR77_006700 [Saxophila tyrrhenica]
MLSRDLGADLRSQSENYGGPSNTHHAEAQNTYDVIIVGGGAAGIGAAVGARQAVPASRILIIESEGFLGGAGTHRGVNSFCGIYSVGPDPKRVVGKIWDDVHSRLVSVGAAAADPDQIVALVQNFDPEGLKVALDDLTADYSIDVLLHCTVVGGVREGTKLSAVIVQERRGRRNLFARAFVDCSGDGDLAYHGGASTRYGNHGRVNMGSLSTRFGGLSGATPTSSLWRDAILAAKKVNPQLEQRIPRNVGVLIKLPGSGDICTYMASAQYDATSSASITAAERQGRKQAQIYLSILRTLPGHENMTLVATGPNFGTRESRHINSRHMLSEKDVLEQKEFGDTVAIGGWYMEWHDSSQPDWPIHFRTPPDGTFNIPLQSLQSIDTVNLYCAGRCADGDGAAGSAIRVMGTALATGQAAGAAAGLSAAGEGEAAAPDVRAVLLKHGAILDRTGLSTVCLKIRDDGKNLSHREALNGH